MNTPLEALERLKELLSPVHRTGPIYLAAMGDVTWDDLRSLLTSYEAQGERLREVEGDAEADRAFNLEALRQIKAAVEYGDNPAMLIETAIRMASIAEVRARNDALSATQQPVSEGVGPNHLYLSNEAIALIDELCTERGLDLSDTLGCRAQEGGGGASDAERLLGSRLFEIQSAIKRQARPNPIGEEKGAEG